MHDSILINTDSYKVSMWKQYPPGTQYIYSYIEARGGRYDKTIFLGVQAFIREYLTKPFTQADLDFADKFWTAHGEPFNREGWQYILDAHNGILPIIITSLDEGSVVETQNVLATIQNTDPKVPWLTTWVETAFLRAIWYPTTVATQSWYIKQLLGKYLEKSGSLDNLPFMLHDFGARGVSSYESAKLGGMAHLVNFSGTDNASAILAAAVYYEAEVYNTGFSIPASEHSTITAWGQDSEALAYENMVRQFSKPNSIYAVVSDSYNIYRAVELWGTQLKELVISSGGILVIRPDSGDPVVVLPKLLHSLQKNFGTTINSKGYLKLNNVKLIWGDGIEHNSINTILRTCVDVMGFSADNFAFGMGGALLQMVNRDTCEFAMKASSAMIDGKSVDVYKEPLTDSSKKSKRGIFSVIRNEKNQYVTIPADYIHNNLLKTRYLSGIAINQITFDQIRKNSLA